MKGRKDIFRTLTRIVYKCNATTHCTVRIILQQRKSWENHSKLRKKGIVVFLKLITANFHSIIIMIKLNDCDDSKYNTINKTGSDSRYTIILNIAEKKSCSKIVRAVLGHILRELLKTNH